MRRGGLFHQNFCLSSHKIHLKKWSLFAPSVSLRSTDLGTKSSQKNSPVRACIRPVTLFEMNALMPLS
jgi:hypothetical protein